MSCPVSSRGWRYSFRLVPTRVHNCKAAGRPCPAALRGGARPPSLGFERCPVPSQEVQRPVRCKVGCKRAEPADGIDAWDHRRSRRASSASSPTRSRGGRPIAGVGHDGGCWRQRLAPQMCSRRRILGPARQGVGSFPHTINARRASRSASRHERDSCCGSAVPAGACGQPRARWYVS